MDNTVGLYHEFLNLMESTSYHDDLITITTEEAPVPCTNLPLNLNLHLNINSYYDMLTVTRDCTFSSSEYNTSNKYEEFPKTSLIQVNDGIGHTSIKLDTEEHDEPFSEPECDNPIVPGLFPAMNIEDGHQFMKFDRLPIIPSYIPK